MLPVLPLTCVFGLAANAGQVFGNQHGIHAQREHAWEGGVVQAAVLQAFDNPRDFGVQDAIEIGIFARIGTSREDV